MNNVSVLFAMAQVASVAVGYPSAGDVRLVPPSRESRSGGGIPKQCEFACCDEKIRTACQHSFLREANGRPATTTAAVTPSSRRRTSAAMELIAGA